MLLLRPLLPVFLSTFMISISATAQDTSIADFEFLQGYWSGTGFGGKSDEMWMPATNGRMFGLFTQTEGTETVFSEFMEIVEVDKQFILRLKHFNPDFTGWEEKTEYVTFTLRSVANNKAEFGSLTYELTSPDNLQVSLRLREADGTVHTEVFSFTRQKMQ